MSSNIAIQGVFMKLRVLLALFTLGSAAWAARVPVNEGWHAIRGSAVPDVAVTRDGQSSLRVEASGLDAAIESAPVSLTIGKRYELSGWVRTDKLDVRDLGRSPIAIGAALTMASMPFDVHSASIGTTHGWTRVSLPFTATRAQDNIVLSVGNGGVVNGRAWFQGVNLDEISAQGEWPSREALSTFGPAYRYPIGGWIYLHIEGKPYERGYQHGHLMASEIVRYIDRCAAELDAKSRERAWELGRTTAKALFLAGYDQEILEEMKGIADGAADDGAKWHGRRIDLEDILAANSITELGELEGAMPVTPTGLEGLHLTPPGYADRNPDTSVTERCSAFAATGPATRGGKMVIAHLTMWPLTLAEQTNVMLDVKPATGHRVLIQSFPGGIQSGTDWYQNDAGIVLTETTIRQSPFNVHGTPESFRARQAIQYGSDIAEVVGYLGNKNNGLYTNEWLIGDAKTNEIAMYELGTYRTKLWSSAKNEWFGNTPGFYWGDNNAKDLSVRLEYAPDPHGAPQYLPYVPEERDLAWHELYRKYEGRIDEQFAFLAFRSAPLVTSTTMDAKVATADMANRMMVWATFGKPNQREWVPSEQQKQQYAKNDGIYPGGYRLVTAEAPESLREAMLQNQHAAKKTAWEPVSPDRLWKGSVLPASEKDEWLAAGAAAYYQDLQSQDLEKTVAARRAAFGMAARAGNDGMQRYRRAENKGALLLDALRAKMGDDRFLGFMREFFDKHAMQQVTAEEFEKAAGDGMQPLFAEWLGQPGLAGGNGRPVYFAANFHRMGGPVANAMIVYGTVMEAGANRYAAEQLQKRLLDWYENAAPISKDFEVSDDD
ncbi:MAG: C45 family autoproteolytic acyltransferase/hydrolase, partial [Bryobacteraceae bacterium]